MSNKLLILSLGAALVIVAFHSLSFKSGGSSEKIDPIIREAFLKWEKEYGKKYLSDTERNRRMMIFSRNYLKIEAHNQNEERTFSKSINQFSDQDNEEFLNSNSEGEIDKGEKVKNNFITLTNLKNGKPLTIESEWNWFEKGMTGTVKSQKKCTSSHHQAAAAAVESAQLIAGQYRGPLSTQELIDCANGIGGATGLVNDGCTSGSVQDSFYYMMQNGVSLEKDYPFQGEATSTCYSQNQGLNRISGFAKVPNSNDELMKAVRRGPVAAKMDGSNINFYFNNVKSCYDHKTVDHSVLIVGYGTSNGQDYWYVQNTWGPSWGIGGYIKVHRSSGDSDNSDCGLRMAAVYPIL